MRSVVFIVAGANLAEPVLRARRELGRPGRQPIRIRGRDVDAGRRLPLWNGTIFDRLEAACIGWEIFEGDEFPVSFALSGMNLYSLEGHVTDFDEFQTKIADPDYAPGYVFI